MICKLCAYQPLHVHRNQPTYDQTYCEQCGNEEKIMLQTPRKAREHEHKPPQKSKDSKHDNGSRKRLRAI